MDIYILDLNSFNSDLLVPELSEKQFASELKRKQHLAGRYIVKQFACRHDIAQPEIIYKNEKPYYKSGEYFFSISHSENMVVVAFEKFEIGLDIENNTKRRNFIDIIKRFDEKLANKIEMFDYDEQRKSFYEFWTKYEAKIKLNSEKKECFYFTKDMKNGFTLSVSAEEEIKNIKEVNLLW